jgi:hypothetical protein
MERVPDQPAEPEHRGRHAAGPEEQRALTERYLDTYGNAFRAFLTLPDTDEHDPSVFDNFDESYIGSYPHDREHVLENVTKYATVRDAIRQLAREAGWTQDVVQIDIDILWNLTQSILFDIVDFANEYHVFGK